MPRLLYSLTLFFLLPITLLKLIWRGFRQPDYLKHWKERYAISFPSCTKQSIWLHCVSVGETRAAESLIKALIKQYPHTPILLTHTTPTGRETGLQLFPRDTYPQIQRCYLPYDLPWAVHRFLQHYQPKLGVLLETELWANLIAGCRQKKIPLILCNARLSAKSAAGYARFSQLSAQALQGLTAIAAQSQEDAARLLQLRQRETPAIPVTGNLKFDFNVAQDSHERGDFLRKLLGPSQAVFLIASSREGEEALILQALKQSPLNAKIIIVPRHPQRFDEVAQLISQYGFRFCRRSEFSQGNVASEISQAQIILGDSMGEMPTYYAASDIAYIGGSLLPFGGQNLIEACAVGTPVLIGPHTFNFAQAAEMAVQAGAAIRVQDVKQLLETAEQLLQHTEQLAQMSLAAKQFVSDNQGATEKTVALIKQMMAH